MPGSGLQPQGRFRLQRPHGPAVASELCTVIDDGTISNRRGSLNVDDEGHPTRRNVLIENGVLTGYLQDKLSSRLMKSASTGSGRRESYAHIPCRA